MSLTTDDQQRPEAAGRASAPDVQQASPFISDWETLLSNDYHIETPPSRSSNQAYQSNQPSTGFASGAFDAFNANQSFDPTGHKMPSSWNSNNLYPDFACLEDIPTVYGTGVPNYNNGSFIPNPQPITNLPVTQGQLHPDYDFGVQPDHDYQSVISNNFEGTHPSGSHTAPNGAPEPEPENNRSRATSEVQRPRPPQHAGETNRERHAASERKRRAVDAAAERKFREFIGCDKNLTKKVVYDQALELLNRLVEKRDLLRALTAISQSTGRRPVEFWAEDRE